MTLAAETRLVISIVVAEIVTADEAPPLVRGAPAPYGQTSAV